MGKISKIFSVSTTVLAVIGFIATCLVAPKIFNAFIDRYERPNVYKKPNVYFSQDMSPQGLVKVYSKVSKNIKGRVAIMLSFENLTRLDPISKDIIKTVSKLVPGSTLVVSKGSYSGIIYSNEDLLALIKKNGWNKFSQIDILDETETKKILIKKGLYLKEVSVGSHLFNYDSMIVLGSFTVDPYVGYRGAIRNAAIGRADGEELLKRINKTKDQQTKHILRNEFISKMVESSKALRDHFKSSIIYINLLNVVPTSCIRVKSKNIGILASEDPVALDFQSLTLFTKDAHNFNKCTIGTNQYFYGQSRGLGTIGYKRISIENK